MTRHIMKMVLIMAVGVPLAAFLGIFMLVTAIIAAIGFISWDADLIIGILHNMANDFTWLKARVLYLVCMVIGVIGFIVSES